MKVAVRYVNLQLIMAIVSKKYVLFYVKQIQTFDLVVED